MFREMADSFALLTYASLVAARTLSKRLLAGLNSLLEEKDCESHSNGSEYASEPPGKGHL